MKLKVTVDGKTYEVDVEAAEGEPSPHDHALVPAQARVPSAAVAPPPPPPQGGAPADEAKVCRSPVTGIVVRVPARVGQALQAGDVVLVLEAMKMETQVTASAPGKIAAIKVTQGDSVKAGQILMELA